MILHEEIEELNQIISPIHITAEEVLSKCRQTQYIYKRAILVYYLRKKKYSILYIGRLLLKHHATIIHSLKYKISPNKYYAAYFFQAIKQIDAIEIKEIERCPTCGKPI